MALINRPMTAVEIRYALAQRHSSFYNAWTEALENPTPHVVQYHATIDEHTYVSPAMFYWHVRDKSPSDCVWIVPNSEKVK